MLVGCRKYRYTEYKRVAILLFIIIQKEILMIKRNQLIYAIKDGMATSIENVESGLKCGCICPSCGEPLVARKGAKRMHHFAHYSGHNCE